MKRVLLLLLAFCLYTTSEAQKSKKDPPALTVFSEVDGVVNYSEVVKVDSMTKDQLYIAAKKWFADAYKSANDVIQLDDKTAGELVGKGIFYKYYSISVLISPYKVTVNHTVKISVKDGKYKYEITNLSGEYYSPPSQYTRGRDIPIALNNADVKRGKNVEKLRTEVHKEILETIESLKTYMSSAQTKKDDW